MKVAMHQPNFLPFVGFFKKMAMADLFVILDDVQFARHDFTNRVKIRTKEGSKWLTVPVPKKNHFKKIRQVMLSSDNRWMEKHKKRLYWLYKDCPYFDNDFIEEYFSTKFKTLQGFNEFGIMYLKKRFGITTDIIRQRDLIVKDCFKSDLILDVMKAVGGNIYIMGAGAQEYMEFDKFKDSGITIQLYKFKPFQYQQAFEGFEPYMSAIDLLFNEGPEGLNEDR